MALDQTPWLLVRGEVLHLSRSGDELDRRSAPDLTGDEPIGFAVDSLRDQLWIAGAHALSRMELHGDGSGCLAAAIDEPRAIALDARSGEVWALVAGALWLSTPRERAAEISLPEDAVMRRHSTTIPSTRLHRANAVSIATNLTRRSHDGRIDAGE